MDKATTTANWFADQLDFYQSANSSNEAIKNNFVIRRAEFELIIDDLKNKKKNDPLQHELVLGRRGSGKSTLLKRLEIEIDEDPTINQAYIAVNLAEEQAAIYRLFDLWMEVIKELKNKLNVRPELRDYLSFKDDQAYTRYLYAVIHNILSEKKKKLVLLLDNLDRIIENFHDDGNLLRETLINHNDLQIIGGSTRMNEHFWRYDQPFYEFFRRHHLEALSIEDIHRLLNHWSEVMNLPKLADFAKNNPGKIEVVRIMTDGLPRTLQFLIQILLQDTTLYGYDYIRKVMDKATPLYQEKLNSLPAPQRKIVLEMAFLWEACSASQLSEKASMQSKLVSAHLKQLTNNGVVETINTSKRNHLYRLSERFFNMWLIVTQGNPDQKRKAKWLTHFLETWYDAADFKTLTNTHIENLRSQKISYDKALILTKALTQSKFTGVEERDEMLDITWGLSGGDKRTGRSELPEKYSDLAREIINLIAKKDYQRAHEIIDEVENEKDGVKFFVKGLLFYYGRQFKEAEKYYLLAIDKGHTYALNCLARVYDITKRYTEGEKYHLLSIKEGDPGSLFDLALSYYLRNINKKKALELIDQYDKIIDLENSDAWVEIILEIWNGIFNNVEARIRKCIMDSSYGNLIFLFENLLYQGQLNIVFNLFNDNIHGQFLQDRYTLLYYAVSLMVDNDKTPDTKLRIPPETLPTVHEIIKEVRQKQLFYGRS